MIPCISICSRLGNPESSLGLLSSTTTANLESFAMLYLIFGLSKAEVDSLKAIALIK